MAGLKRDANFYFMLAGLLITLVLGPLLMELSQILDIDLAVPRTMIVQSAFSLTMIVAIWSVIDSRAWTAVGILLIFSVVGSSLLDRALGGNIALTLTALGSMLLFCALSLYFTVRHLVAEIGEISLNRLVGAICVYLLLGIGLGVLNMLLEILLPGSFAGLTSGGPQDNGMELIYFSFVTMTTLGYGDVTPARPLSQALAYMAAVAGQFYIAVLVAALVAEHITANAERRRQKPR